MRVVIISHNIRLCVAQINSTVGDIKGNSQKILEAALKAKNQGSTLILTPELSLSGYPPEDLLLRDDFNAQCHQELLALATLIKDITLIVGHPHVHHGDCYNAASVLQNGRVLCLSLIHI